MSADGKNRGKPVCLDCVIIHGSKAQHKMKQEADASWRNTIDYGGST